MGVHTKMSTAAFCTCYSTVDLERGWAGGIEGTVGLRGKESWTVVFVRKESRNLATQKTPHQRPMAGFA